MSALRNWKISAKLGLAFGAMLTITLLVGLLSMHRLDMLAAEALQITGSSIPNIEALNRMNDAASDIRIAELRYVFADSPEVRERYSRRLAERETQLKAQQDDYAARVQSSAERAVWDKYLQEWRQYAAVRERALGLAAREKAAEVRASIVDQGSARFEALGAAMDAAIALEAQAAAARAQKAAATSRLSRYILIGLLVGAAALGTVCAVLASGAIARPLSEIIGLFKRMSAGDLNNRIDTTRGDELGVVLAGLAELQDKLRKLIAENQSQLDAIDKVQAVIEFELDGTVLTANDNFLRAMGYELDEIRGRHHSMFVDAEYRNSREYRELWEKLRRGEFDSGRYLRLGQGGRPVWIQASYNPLFDASGKPYKVVKFASDVTAQVLLARETEAAVGQTQAVIKSAVEGDLTARIAAGDKTGALRKLADSINALVGNMGEIVARVKLAAGEVHRGADEIAQGNANLSQRTEEQSSSLEEAASSMDEMTSTVKQNADNAGQANQLAAAARAQAEQGGAVVGKAVRAMSEINDASRKIADIIGVIDEIAFQTNLLALNAAVEAARAGEQGRGFAVVASEVRSLAGRSASAAKQIKELIQDSVQKVADGSVLVTQSGQTLEQIVRSVTKVSNIVAEIAAASREQSAGIEQVNRAVMQMDAMTQQNASLVEQATAASQAMAGQARGRNEMMSRYRIEDDTRPVAMRASAAPHLPGDERRAVQRPWSLPAAQSVPRARTYSASPTQPAKAVGDDSEWREF